MENKTEMDEFILLGFTNFQGFGPLLFPLFLLFYLVTLLGNSLIVLVILAEPCLHTPMYFFLSNLSCLDICYATVTVPKMLAGFLSGPQAISFCGCLAQLHFFHFTGSSEGVLLAVMGYDRYVAICYPLRYAVIMNKPVCLLLASVTWSTGFFHALVHTVMTSRLHFCGPKLVQHFFCDIKPLLRLACGSIQLNISLLNIVTGSLVMISFFLTLLSYLYIIAFLFLKVQSHRLKAFSTCSSHLTVVVLFYIPVLVNYLSSSSEESLQQEMIATLMYNVGVSVLNPLIYTLRNKEMKHAISKIVRKIWLAKI
ncbi:olfactory receptor 12D2-like [Sphaerodactylus townsendi]|uniref:olfactory receptor 12D2-like n=1 Tax=Sphaerodactylus townsendi TaxID=933632 RepID=UPI002025DB46|nr:olfactory receptor 12D2-like [Sphaerodactylus townsendi]